MVLYFEKLGELGVEEAAPLAILLHELFQMNPNTQLKLLNRANSFLLLGSGHFHPGIQNLLVMVKYLEAPELVFKVYLFNSITLDLKIEFFRKYFFSINRIENYFF